MRKQNKLTVSLMLILLCCRALRLRVAGQGRFRGRPEFLPYTRNLPAVDQIELFQLKAREGQFDGGAILATKVLTGAAAKKVASLWRKQTYTSSDSACQRTSLRHQVLLSRKTDRPCDRLLVLQQYVFHNAALERQQTFEGGNKRGEELSEVFRLAFAGDN